MINMKNLNRETKIFFVILLFLFLTGILFMKIDSFLAYYTISMDMGAAIGFFCLYTLSYLEIYTGKEKITLKQRPPLKMVKRGYIFYLFVAGVILIVIGLIYEPSTSELFFVAGMAGAIIITSGYFGGLGRLKIYKEELEKEK